ncbi:ATP-binding protein [Caldilinea sp.]|jgi:two-component system OmpR family sensor kinase|uniref:sensor histidine kinase n=1 Tax=Caldilinea sp. TaxID=2293560 RepID=UPI001B18757E|nr:ATP-binding protein [Caldilinea sp.]MBO9392395.1 HAMP domain-containing protein [Caldilinea sp.]
MTIRLRLTLWYTALLGITLILFSVTVYSALAANLRFQLEQSAALQARNIAAAVAQQFQGDVLVFRSRAGNVFFPQVELFASSVGAQLLDTEGNVLKRSENLGDLPIPHHAETLPRINAGLDDRYYYISSDGAAFLVYTVPLFVNNQLMGAVQIIQPVTTALTALTQVNRYLILGTTISIVLAAIVGAFLARRALAPIDTITETANAITRAHDLSKRIDIRDNASEVGRLAATFNAMLDRIQQLFQAQERLIGDVSHELRTPLTTIQGNIELLQRMAASSHGTNSLSQAEVAELLQESLNEVKAESERMNKMISDLLLLAQADSGALQIQMAPVEMDTLLLDVYRQTRRLVEHYKGRPDALEVRLGSEDQALVRGDRERLRQVLVNLAENAVKYTPEGGVITFSLENRDGWVRISVSDTGIGISEEQQAAIFERFYRTDKARSREMGGSGLGLSIAQRIAQAHNGKITVVSQLNQGSTFTLWLPEWQEAPSEAPINLKNTVIAGT